MTASNAACGQRVTGAFVILVGVTFGAFSADRCRAESHDVYEITTATAVALLPNPLRMFLEQHLDAVTKAVAGELVREMDSTIGQVDVRRHYIMLDIDAVDMEPGARVAAARRFPHEWGAAKRLFKQHQIRHGGTLPWVIVQRFHALVRAFRASSREAVLVEVGRLLHYATDASLPFHATMDRDGSRTGQLLWPADTTTLVDRMHRTVRLRCERALVSLFRKQFDYEVRVWAERWERSSDPLADVFSALLDAHGGLAELTRIDAELTTSLDLHSAGAFVAAANLYYAELMKRAGPIMESRLEAGALLGANLVGSAWLEAGRPALDFEMAAPPRTEPAPAGTTENPQYIGSRHSTLYHVSTCPHARRIRPENQVGFGSLEQARSAGRAPCRTCKPDAP